MRATVIVDVESARAGNLQFWDAGRKSWTTLPNATVFEKATEVPADGRTMDYWRAEDLFDAVACE